MQEILVAAHCLLNPAVRLDGLKPPERPQLSGSVIQLPCPEAAYFGLKRWEVTSEQLDIPNYRRFCRSIFRNTADVLQMLYKEGHTIKLMGVRGSPSCGSLTTAIGMKGGRLKAADHSHITGTGIFFQEIFNELKQREVEFKFDEL